MKLIDTGPQPAPLVDSNDPELGHIENYVEPRDVRGQRLWNRLAELVREDVGPFGSYSPDRALYVASELDEEDARTILRHCIVAWANQLDRGPQA